MRCRVLVTEPYRFDPRARATLADVAEVVDLHGGRPELLAALPSFEAIVVRLGHRIDAEVLQAGTRLRAIATPTTGLDHIDVSEASRRGIEVISLRGERRFLDTITATPEHTWALLLAAVRRVVPAARAVAAGEWDRERFRGRQLAGSTLGIVGLGRVGCRVAEYGIAFGMAVLAYDPAPEFVPSTVRLMPTLRELLAASDVVSVHAALDESTHHLVDADAIAAMRADAILVNTARGAILDEHAVAAAIRSGHLGAVAVDVIEDEPMTRGAPTGPLVELARSNDRVLVTPHIAGAASDAMAATERFIAEKLRAALNG